MKSHKVSNKRSALPLSSPLTKEFRKGRWAVISAIVFLASLLAGCLSPLEIAPDVKVPVEAAVTGEVGVYDATSRVYIHNNTPGDAVTVRVIDPDSGRVVWSDPGRPAAGFYTAVDVPIREKPYRVEVDGVCDDGDDTYNSTVNCTVLVNIQGTEGDVHYYIADGTAPHERKLGTYEEWQAGALASAKEPAIPEPALKEGMVIVYNNLNSPVEVVFGWQSQATYRPTPARRKVIMSAIPVGGSRSVSLAEGDWSYTVDGVGYQYVSVPGSIEITRLYLNNSQSTFASPPRIERVDPGINRLSVTLGHSSPQADVYEVYYKKGAGLSADDILAGSEGMISVAPSAMTGDITGLVTDTDYSLVAIAKKAGYADRRSAPVTATTPLVLDLTPQGETEPRGYWTWNSPVYTINTSRQLLIVASGGQTVDKGVKTSGDSPKNIILQDVNITMAGDSPFEVIGTVSLALRGTNTLRAGGNHAGLQVEKRNAVTISGAGSLYAYGSEDSAGIGGGGNHDGAGGIITISGGTVNAAGAGHGPGIGDNMNMGGIVYPDDGANITITGGTVIATGGTAMRNGEAVSGGAGIGAGLGHLYFSCVSENSIFLYVDTGPFYTCSLPAGCLADIDYGFLSDSSGGGFSGFSTKSGNITITGGTITATGGAYAAGIGGSGGWPSAPAPYLPGKLPLYVSGGDANSITIQGDAVVNATGGQGGGAGIGGGHGAGSNTITIGGSARIIATGSAGIVHGGSYGGAGIGGGAFGRSGIITINGGDVTARGAANGAGIGGGGGNTYFDSFLPHPDDTVNSITINGSATGRAIMGPNGHKNIDLGASQVGAAGVVSVAPGFIGD